jgi:hypothetical protein
MSCGVAPALQEAAMARPVFMVSIGALAGAAIAVVNLGGDIGRKLTDGAVDVGMSASRLIEPPSAGTPLRVSAPDASHFMFSTCVHKTGASVEQTLLDLVEFHEHGATLTLVNCLLSGEPARFCTPAGRQQAADAMEIYLWSRDDSRRVSPAHGLAAKIHWLDRAAKSGGPAENPDLFVFTWSGPDDKAVFDRLRELVKQGYLDPGAFAFSGRAELRDALRDVTPEASPCLATAEK